MRPGWTRSPSCPVRGSPGHGVRKAFWTWSMARAESAALPGARCPSEPRSVAVSGPAAAQRAPGRSLGPFPAKDWSEPGRTRCGRADRGRRQTAGTGRARTADRGYGRGRPIPPGPCGEPARRACYRCGQGGLEGRGAGAPAAALARWNCQHDLLVRHHLDDVAENLIRRRPTSSSMTTRSPTWSARPLRAVTWNRSCTPGHQDW